MRLLLILEHHFFKDNQGNVWCDRVVDYKYLERYLMSFDYVLVCARMEKVSVVEKNWKLASGNRVAFLPMKNFKGAKESIVNISKIRQVVRRGISKTDRCIMRVPSPISILAYNEVKKSGKPFAFEFVMGADKMFLGEGLVYQFVNALVDGYVKKMCMNAKGVSYVTKHILQNKYPTRGFAETYSSINLNSEDYHQKNWKVESIPKEFILVNTGYMDDYRKGQDICIKALSELKRKGYNVKLILIGDGNLRSEFENIANQCGVLKFVDFTGLINDKSVIQNYLKTAHLFILPSQSEGLPRSILEAMACGLPCVTSDVDGIPELIDKQYMIHEFNPQKYADVIESLLSNWSKMIRVGEINYRKACSFKKDKLDAHRKRFYDMLIKVK